MKNILNIIIISFLTLLSYQLKAQVNYTYTLTDNGGYNYTIEVVPEVSASNFATSVQSYGFTIILPDGITASIQSSLGNGASATFFNGTDVGSPNIDGYLITETLGSPIALPAPSAAMNSAMVTIQLNGSPTSGTISILANDSSLATLVPPLQSFVTADTTDNGSASFENTVNSASGLSGISMYDFSTLAIPENTFSSFTVYPNPIPANSGTLNIKWSAESKIATIRLKDIQGRIVKAYENYSLQRGNNTITIPKLNTGLYVLSLQANDKKNNCKIIVK